MRTPVAVGCALAVAALLGTSGCGPHSAHATSRSGRPTPTTTSPTTTATATGTAATSAAGGDSAARRALLAAANLVEAKKSADFTTDADFFGKRSTESGTYTWGNGEVYGDVRVSPAAVGMQNLSHAKTIEQRQIGSSSYFRVALRGHWVRIDMSAYLGADGAKTAASADGDPASLLRQLAATADLRQVGTATVDGKSTTDYQGHVPASSADRKKGLVEPTLVDAWLTGDGTLVRSRQDRNLTTVTMDYKRFGGAKAITAPPGWDVTDITDTVQAQRQQALKPSS